MQELIIFSISEVLDMQELIIFSISGGLIGLILLIVWLRFQHQPLKSYRLLLFTLIMMPISYGWIVLFYLAQSMLPDGMLWLAWILPTGVWLLIGWLLYRAILLKNTALTNKNS